MVSPIASMAQTVLPVALCTWAICAEISSVAVVDVLTNSILDR
jgi:hypothetical protein